jgi:hypothetical protein
MWLLILAWFTDAFSLTEVGTHLVLRGTRYPPRDLSSDEELFP